MQKLGQRVRLPKDERIFIVRKVREDRYLALYNNGAEAVIASPCHPCEVVK
jgi:hypothetical protein